MGKRKTHEEFVQEIKSINPNIEILGEYINAITKIKCKCLIDEHIWYPLPNNIIRGNGCPRCWINNKIKKETKPHQKFIEEMKNKKPKVEVLGEYINNYTKVKCKCLIDGYEWEAIPNSLLSGCGCPKCGGTKKKTHEEFIEEVKKINQYIKILGKYINANTKIRCECLYDGYIWEPTPSMLLSGRGCPSCKFSKGEKLIENYCKRNYLQYKSQFKISECKYIKQLPFDFALFNKNKLIVLIEYQGVQHYKVVKYFGGESGYNSRKKRDEIKRNYCSSNNIPLIEIPFWIDDIEGYLEEQMDKFINKPLQLSLI